MVYGIFSAKDRIRVVWPLRNLLLSLASALVLLAVYLTSNRLLAEREGFQLATFVEGGIPFLPWTILIYNCAFPALLFPALVIRRQELLNRILLGFAACTLVALVFFIWLPVRVPRPGIPTQENFFYWSTALLFTLDRPVNAFPALLPMYTAYAALSSLSLLRRLRWWLLAANLAIAFAALSLRQHTLADLCGGWILGGVAYFVVVRPALRRESASGAKDLAFPEKNALRFFTLCVLPAAVCILLFQLGLRFAPVLPVN